MKITSTLQNLVIRSLSESVAVPVMESLAKELIQGYNLHESTGFPPNFPIPNRDAARQICRDMTTRNLFPQFVSLLLEININGYFGRKIKVSHLRTILNEIHEQGFIYDDINRIFVEDQTVRKTKNWGVLTNKNEYILAFLRIDIVGNTEIVRKHSDKIIKQTYADLLAIVDQSTDKRSGRIWNWEGDGGLVAFFLSNKNQLATLSGMEILHELFLYNQMKCYLERPLEVRIAIHSSYTQYTTSIEELLNNETVKTVSNIESKLTQPNSLTITRNVHMALDGGLAKQFTMCGDERGIKCYNYHLDWEQ